MDFNQEKLFDEWFAEAGLTPDELEATKKVLAQEKVAAKLRESVLARSDYSKNMDAIRNQQTEIERLKSDTEREYYQMLAADHNNKEAWVRLQEENQQLKSNYSSDSYSTDDNYVGLTEEQIQKRVTEAVNKSQEDSLRVLDKALSIYDSHRREFGNEDFQLNDVIKSAVNSGLPLEKAYNEMVAGKRAEAQMKKHQAEIEKAKQEAIEEYASKHALPTVAARPRGVHPLRPEGVVPTTSEDRVAAAIAAFRKGE